MDNHTTDCRIHDDGSCCDCGVIAAQQANSATGNQSVTGIGFRPRRLELMATLPSNSIQQVSNSVVGANGVASCYAWSADGASGACSTTGNRAWTLLPANGTPITAEASFVSFDDDGFTVNITTGGAQPFVRYVAYP